MSPTPKKTPFHYFLGKDMMMVGGWLRKPFSFHVPTTTQRSCNGRVIAITLRSSHVRRAMIIGPFHQTTFWWKNCASPAILCVKKLLLVTPSKHKILVHKLDFSGIFCQTATKCILAYFSNWQKISAMLTAASVIEYIRWKSSGSKIEFLGFC